MIADDRAAQIRARAEAATDGPWESDSADPSIWSPDVIVIGNYTRADDYNSAAWEDATEADREFIAHARSDIPWLLAEVERLTAENQEQRARLSAYRSPDAGAAFDAMHDEARQIEALTAERDVALSKIDRVADLFEGWHVEEQEHRRAGAYGIAEGLVVASQTLRAALDGDSR